MKNSVCMGALCLILGAGVASAQLQFRPMSVDLSPEGRNSSATFTVTNSGAKPIAVRLRMLTREVAEDGSEKQSPVERDAFSLFPASLVLEPAQSRAVRLTWRGPVRIEKERAYRILAEQVPVDFAAPDIGDEKGRININIFLRYLGAVYVRPESVAPSIVTRAERTADPNRVNVVIENVGTGKTLLQALKVTITGTRDGRSSSYQVDREQLKDIDNANMLAGLRRVQPVILPADFPDGPLSVDIEFEKR